MIKKLGKDLLCRLLERQVRALRARHDFKLIAVAGSVGKTSTKLAIAELLGTQAAVRFQDGNYNDRLTVPLIFFGQPEPSIFNIPAWLKILWSNQRAIKQSYPYQFVVVELGPDGPGQMHAFAYLQPDLTVLTAVAPEHMAFFKTLDAVAAEETKVFDYSQVMLVNHDDVAAEYLTDKTYHSYGLDRQADYYLSDWQPHDLKNPQATLHLDNGKGVPVTLQTLGQQGAKINLAAAAVAHELGFAEADIVKGLAAIKPAPGRMQILAGQHDSMIIDDTYNSSPLAAKAALDVLYTAQTKQRIAILGSMNELGEYSQTAHREVGAYCDPKKLELVVTIGREAGEYLAAAAEEQGCQVQRFDDALLAGDYVAGLLKTDAVVLAKGSQNDVFAEEAVKKLLANSQDAQRLVRQSSTWLAQKRRSGLSV
ncbi:MAG TPA: Mur ligase family protein [Candidatus Saccharimonadales bacterium]|nr:Mur ligase family protein [Candidatus Saccharimonadales bacterium]